MQPVCRTCRSLQLTCTLAEQVKGIQDHFVETTHVPELPIYSITPLLWPPTPGRSFPVNLLPRRVLEAFLAFASSAHRQCLCKVLLGYNGKSGALAQPECFGGIAPHWGTLIPGCQGCIHPSQHPSWERFGRRRER